MTRTPSPSNSRTCSAIDGADTTIPRKVAEKTGGVYAHINDSDSNLATLMTSYYLSLLRLEGHRRNTSLSGVRAILITMAMPVYIGNQYFVGVVGIDLPLTLLSESYLSYS